MLQNQNLLIIGTVFPEPNSSAAGSRMMQIIAVFQNLDFKITFASAANESEFMADLQKTGVLKKNIFLNDNSFDAFVKKLNPDIVIFDRFITEEQFGWRVAENCPDAMRILDTEDLHCLRFARQYALKENRNFETKDLFSDVAYREIASILKCDLSLIISEFEMNLLQDFFKIDKQLLHYLPFLLNEIDIKTAENWKTFEERTDFIFIGNFYHEPNWDAVLYLKEIIFPLIKKQLPKAILKIYGAYPGQKVLQLHNPKEGFFVLGRAENANKVVGNAKVCLAPLRFGAGIKGKLVEAMRCGTPSVTTLIGAEGMVLDSKWNGFIADNPIEFANLAVELYQNKLIWENAQKNGIAIYNNRYSKNKFEIIFVNRILELQKNFKNLRLNNFLGSMLQFQNNLSSKYLSKWLAEKNKKAE
ncbi:MAG: glycosyltransferase family 4 protein [Flavobacterium sp.]|nr:glycosyltransferase family 4 protein [Flavobacterium sp.]